MKLKHLNYHMNLRYICNINSYVRLKGDGKTLKLPQESWNVRILHKIVGPKVDGLIHCCSTVHENLTHSIISYELFEEQAKCYKIYCY